MLVSLFLVPVLYFAPNAVQPSLGPALAEAQEARWYAVAHFREEVAKNEQIARTRRAAPAPRAPRREAPVATGRCGGDLPSCAVMMCESGGNPRAVLHSSIRPAGKWQIITDTWAGYGGYATADQAPESVQDERARQIYAGGRGRSQWEC